MRDVKRGERMRDNLFDESRLIFEAREDEFIKFFKKGCAFLQKRSPT